MPTNADLVEEIKRMIKEMGSQVSVASELEISPSYLSEILSGRKEVSDAVARQLGYEKVAKYERIDNHDD